MTITELLAHLEILARNASDSALKAYQHLLWSPGQADGAYAVSAAFALVGHVTNGKDAAMEKAVAAELAFLRKSTRKQVRKARKTQTKKAA